MRASIRDVAEQARVSRMTVTRVLQGRKDLVNSETYNRVLTVMHQLEYVPVRSARQNHHIKTNVISMVPHYRNPSRGKVDIKTFEGMCDQASRSGYDLFVMLRGEAEWMANREELRFLDRRSDGFIFVSPGENEWQTALPALVKHDVPVVVCYRREVPQGVVWVAPDNNGIIDLSLDYLVRFGHKNIVYFSGPKTDVSDEDLLANLSGVRMNSDNKCRIKRFCERMVNLGVTNPERQIVQISATDWQVQSEQVQALLADGVTAAICGDIFAFQMCNILGSLGKSVPQDMSIICIDNEINSVQHNLTSVEFGYDAVGRAAVQAWQERQAGIEASRCCKVVPVSLIERASVGPPRPV